MGHKSEWLIDWDDPEAVKQRSRDYYRKHRDRLRQLKKDRYCGEYAELLRQVSREWYRANKDKKRAYWLTNREKIRRYRKDYYIRTGRYYGEH